MNKESLSFKSFRFGPLILLIWGLYSIIFVPIIPIASGFGWDGVFYGKIAMNFQNMIGSMDNYHAGRIFPGVLVHYVLVSLKSELTIKNALIAYQYYYLIILVMSGVYWVKIGKLLKLSSTNFWIGFISLFITYPVLNWYLYYPALTDGTTLFIGILLVYYYIRPNYLVMILAAIISFFSWPTGILMCFLIYLYAETTNVFWNIKVVSKAKLLVIIVVLTPLLILVLAAANIDSITSYVVQSNLKGGFMDVLRMGNHGIKYSLGIFINSLLLVMYYIWIYWILMKDFNISLFFKFHLKREILIRTVFGICLLGMLVLVKKQLVDPTIPSLPAIRGYALPVIKLSSRFTVQFIVCHIAYWGPSIILCILYFKRVITYMKSANPAIILGFLVTIIFSINGESRAITNFYPFLIFILVQVIDFDKMKNFKLFSGAYLFISIVISKIWLHYDLPGTVFPRTLENGLDKFPLQWYFMNFGLWINLDMYLLHAFIVLLFGITIFTIIRQSEESGLELSKNNK